MLLFSELTAKVAMIAVSCVDR